MINAELVSLTWKRIHHRPVLSDVAIPLATGASVPVLRAGHSRTAASGRDQPL